MSSAGAPARSRPRTRARRAVNDTWHVSRTWRLLAHSPFRAVSCSSSCSLTQSMAVDAGFRSVTVGHPTRGDSLGSGVPGSATGAAGRADDVLHVTHAGKPRTPRKPHDPSGQSTHDWQPRLARGILLCVGTIHASAHIRRWSARPPGGVLLSRFLSVRRSDDGAKDFIASISVHQQPSIARILPSSAPR
jgi:hypothetical protein